MEKRLDEEGKGGRRKNEEKGLIMQTIENRINELHLGDPVTFRKLMMFPLKGQGETSIDYLTKL